MLEILDIEIKKTRISNILTKMIQTVYDNINSK